MYLRGKEVDQRVIRSIADRLGLVRFGVGRAGLAQRLAEARAISIL